MTTPSTRRPQAGERIHFRESGFTFAVSEGYSGQHVSRRGQVVTVTAALIEASLDRNGDSWLDLVDDESAQRERWGAVQFGRGPWPEDEPLFAWGSPEWSEARQAANKLAHAVIHPVARREALAKVHADFGPSKPTSKTLRNYDAAREHGDEILRRAETAEHYAPDTSREAEAKEMLLHEAELIRRQRAHVGEEV